MKKKFFATIILFVVLASNFVPFLQARAEPVDYPNLLTAQMQYAFDGKATQKDYVLINLKTQNLDNYNHVKESNFGGNFKDDSFYLVVNEKSNNNYTTIKMIPFGSKFFSNKTDQSINNNINGAGLVLNKEYKLSLYYRSEDAGINGAGAVDLLGNQIQNYYLIGSSPDFIYNDELKSTSEQNVGVVKNDSESSTGSMPECSTGFLTISVSGCIAQLVYYALFVPTSFVFGLTGELLDFSIKYTTDSDSYGGEKGSFVNEGWKITRDLANIAFIFILLYTAIGTILNLHGVEWKKTLAKVIIIGLVINFSLFASKVVIDAGNILARVFYSSMGVKSSDTNSVATNNALATDQKSVSVAIVSKFNPQSLFNSALNKKEPIVDGNGNITEKETPVAPSTGWFIIITLIMVILNLIGIYVFFTVAFLFLARTAGLWILMIFAPIAFISYIVPIGGGGGGHSGH